MAESVIGLFKTEVIRHAGPWKGLDQVEFATLEWVHWLNHERWLAPLGYLPQWSMKRRISRASRINTGVLRDDFFEVPEALPRRY